LQEENIKGDKYQVQEEPSSPAKFKKRLGSYIIQQTLGSGTFSKTKLAVNS